MTADWSKDFWKARETESEHAERVEAAAREARWYHERATKAQTDLYHAKLADLAPYRGPLFERKRAQALRDWREATKPAAELFEKTCIEIMATGEVSEATGYAWELLEVGSAMQAAE
jgi:hypothetical protein